MLRTRTARVIWALMRSGRDRRSENPGWVMRGKSACFCLGPISGSHQGQRSKRPHSQAGYMTAPERFAESQIPLAPRAPSIHDLGCVKTKSDLVAMPSGGRILRFFALSVTTSLKIPGAVIPRSVFTQPRPTAATRPSTELQALWSQPLIFRLTPP